MRRALAIALLVLGTFTGLGAWAQVAPDRVLAFDHASTGFALEGAHVGVRCESCHLQGTFRGTPRDCATCHSPGGRAPGKPASHIPATAGCSSCHSSISWTPANFRHRADQGVTAGDCASCHNGATAPGKPLTHPVTTASCDTCHASSAWLPAGYSHALTTPGTCASCHNGTKATGKQPSHIPTTVSCDACHAAGSSFAPITVDVATLHAKMAGPVSSANCTTCHSGGFVSQNAQTKPATHVATTAQCDTCHKSTTTWATATFEHLAAATPVTGRCADCHGVTALGKPVSHVPTTRQCDTCHTNFTAFNPAQMNHIAVEGRCDTCHNGSFNFADAQPKTTAHIPTTAQCDTCHVSGFVSWSPSPMNHDGMAGKCITCHSGGFISQNAQTKPANHVATTAQCDTCHTSTTTWATATFDHSAASTPVAGRCSSCHNGAQALGKPTTHIPTGAQCDTCHSGFVAFKPAQMNHAGLAGQCANCHNGSFTFANALARPTNHIPASTQCDSCHVSGFVAWTPATMNHGGLQGLCSSCHNGTYLAQNAQVKPATHVTTTAQCDTCHTTTTTWATVSFVHAADAVGQCSICHNSQAALGKPTNHIPTTAQCDTCHNGYAAFKPARMEHAGTAGQCASCHNGSYVYANALGRSNSHIPTIASCDTCHTQGFTAWSPAVMNHAGLAGVCSNCHSGGYLTQNAQTKPTTHIATTQQCDTCHGSTTTWATVTFNHATATPAVAGRCSTCHNGTNALGKPTNHIPTGAQCDTCHKTFTAFAPATMSHAATTGPVSAGNCSSCHSGAHVFANAQAKSATHVTTTEQCDVCHKSTISWLGAAYVHDAAAAGKCSNCHNGSTALGKPASTHIPTSAQCDTCHTGFGSFKSVQMNHAGLAGQCASCHGGSYTAVNARAKPNNHIPTGAQCDSCHVNGFVAFAPATMNHAATTAPASAGNCATCHGGSFVAVNAQTKPTTHIATTQQCDTCHSSTTTWATVTFNHATATPAVAGRCSTCHNSVNALGKPTNHIPTTAQCDTCHKVFTAFAPASMNHAATTGPVAAGNCASCHNGSYVFANALAKPATHIVTTQQCDTCHTTVAWKPSTFAHTGVVAGTCVTCHNGTQARGKGATHLPTSAACDSCHIGYAAFAPAMMNHGATAGPLAAGNCATCHSGAYLSINAQVKPATHVATTAQCDTCHTSTTTWATATFVHDAAAVGRCSTCHNSVNALGKPTTHIPTSAQCDTCHTNYTTFRPARMSHEATTGPSAVGNCTSCHNGAYTAVNALAKPATHIPTTTQCDSCHTKGYTTWSPAVMNHAGLAGQCASCHSGAYLTQNAQTKPATHIPTTQQCDSCHNSITTWATGTFNHASATPAVAGRCADCHNSVNALGKPTNHIPTTAQCDTCHKTFAAFAPAAMSHAGTTGPVAAGNCASCHSGAYQFANAQAKPVTHVTTTAQCDDCHKSTTTWSGALYVHDAAAAAGRCATCHNGSTALGKPVSTHIPTSAQCDTCHNGFSAFRPAQMNHAGLAGQCATCHNGVYTAVNALARPTNHIPTGAQCDNCHINGFTSFAPATMNHAATTGPVSAGNCAICHSGSYVSVNAQTKPTTHIATTQQCDGCHSSTTTWATVTFDHSTATPAVAGRCSTCHNSVNALGKPTNHVPTTAQCDTCHKSFAAFAPATMSHAGTTGPVAAGNCSSCHNGSYLFAKALAKPTSHIPTTSQCDTCHVNGFAAFAPATMNHGAAAGPVSAGNCTTCHSGGYLAQNAQTKPATHIATTQQCDSCHSSTTTWATATFNHATATPAVAGRCSTCHNSVNALGKPTNHVPTDAQCDTCHKNFTAFAPASMSHTGTTGPVAAGNCASCHGGAYVFANALAKPATHVTTTAQCDTCHASTISWAGATYQHDATAAGNCSTCHNGTTARAKPTNHIPTTAQCDTCHTNYSSFAPATMNHAATTGPVSPGNCVTCHSGSFVSVNAQTKPATHIATTQQCDTCHGSTTTWATASFDHATATPAVAGRCSTCHNSTNALGKPTNHIPTTAQCDTCHKTFTAFAPATMSHAGTTGPVAAGNCASCHNGSYVFANALAKPTNHIPTTSQCDTCHVNGFATFAPATMNHAGTAGPVSAANCATCHSGSYLAQNAQTKPATHIATTQQCDTCHTSTTTWATATFNHATATPAVAGRCADCHNSVNALGKPTNHIPTTAQCDTCHKTFTAFAPAAMSHAGTTGPAAAGNCASCHSGAYVFANALAKPASHVTTTAQCDTCHASTISWTGASYQHDATAVGRCSTCHNGTTARAKPTNHIPTTAQCDSCHTNYSTFAPATMNHAATTGPAAAGNCASCHSGSYLAQNAQTKPTTHIATTQQCDACHSSTTTWATATFNHATATPAVAGRCSTCHNSTNALGKPTNHIPTTAQCDTCHKTFTAFAPATMSHAGTTGPVAAGNCASCHNGSYVFANALAKPTTHIPTTAQCDTCHTNYNAFAPATMNHAGTAGPVSAANCATCHSGSYLAQNAQTKPVTHIATTQQCDTCHTSTTTWATATFNHATATPAVTGRCADCHNSVNALGKPTNHIPTSAQCDTCHKVFTAFAPASMSHAGTTGPVSAGNCASCHSGAYVYANALAKPPTHVTTTAQCDTCHNSTISWTGASYIHDATAVGKCSTCHNGTTARAKPTNHIPTTAQCDSCHTNYSTFAPATMNHAATTGPVSASNCVTCHSGTYVSVNAQTKPTTHIATTQQCDTCHSSTTTWATATFNHATATPAVAGRCSTCHNSTNALGKPTNHIPTGAQCDTCHKTFTAFAPATMSHAGTTGPVAAGNCASCHNGSYVFANALSKPTTHIPTTAQCDTCHTNYNTFAPATMNHAGTAGPVSAANCATCHSGSYLAQNAQTKPATHIATTQQCDSCHSSTTTWATATFNHATATPAVAGRCSSCHNSVNALGKPTNHIPTTGQCDTCHKVFTAFAPATMSHSGTIGPVSAGNCASCHSGAYVFANALAKPATHVVTAEQCDSCHTSTISWTGASYVHDATAVGKCSTCHNGTTARAKPTNHIPTTAQCDSCHTNYSTFAPATMNHAATTGPVSAGNCVTCHSGTYVSVNAQTKPTTHIATTQQCDTCHSSTTTWATATFNHATATPAVAGRCSTCHNSTNALGKPTNHIPTGAQCDTCHKTFTAFAPATMSHAGTTGPVAAGNCASCHSGAYVFANALAKPTTHIPTTAQCDTCHTNYNAFAPATMNHAGTAGPVSAANCSTCHSGSYLAQNAQTKPTTHIATTQQCDTCHSSTTTWATATFNHATATPAVAGRCADCHNSVNALGKPTNHIPTMAQCDTCHKTYTAFAPATMSHAGTSGPVATGNCSSCHNGGYVYANALAKPVTHVVTTAQCDSCHASTISWTGASYVHDATAVGRCSTCHNGTTARAKPTNHIPTTAQCDSCHTNYSSFVPATMNHAATTGPVSASNCVTCHSGTYVSVNAQTKPTTHIATTQQCDTCHSSTTTWATATFNHATATPAVAGRCSTCHNSVNALGKPTNHIPTTAQCDTCHKTFTAFAPATMSHAGTTAPVAAGNCATCHNGSYQFANALAKPTTHIPTTAQCDTCHTNYNAFAPATMNHAGTAGPVSAANCATCHSGSYLAQNAQTKPVTHIATTQQCDTCHSSTTTWATATFNHATATPAVAGRCSTCHNSVNALGKPTNHIPTSAQCDTCHKVFTAFAPASMSHAGTTGPVSAGNCASCHSGAYVYANALAKPPTHVTTTAQCDTCHNSTISWTGASYIHDAAAVGKCSTCHNGTTARAKPTNHIPTTAQCDACHTNYNTFAPATMNHAATTGPVAASNCVTCHSGTYLAQNAQTKPTTHIATTQQCDSCHSSTTTWATVTFNHATATPAVAGRCSTCHNSTSALGKPTNHIPTSAQCDTCHKTFTAFAPATMSHAGTTGPVAAGNCASCHNGSYVFANALAKPATHIVTTQQCDSCHTTVAWKPSTFAHTGVVAGTCVTCHNGTQARGKGATHLPTSAVCDTCHIGYSAFAPAMMNHGATTGPLAAGNCATCHSGAYLSINAQVKPTTHVATTAQCDTCHTSTTTWATATFVHSATAVGQCSTCHNSVNALGKPTTHIPTSAQCDTCHKNYVAFAPATMNHVATTGPSAVGNCTSCHNGAYTAVNALAKPATHIPTSTQCDSCHTKGYTTWSPAVMNHAGLAGQCVSCHSGAYVTQNAQTKPATHIPTTQQCDSCHNSTTTWATGTFNHATATPAVAGRCATCHNSVNALGKPTNHIPTTAQCDTCHKNFTAFAPATMSHAGTTGPVAAGNCASCHSGAYQFANAQAKPATHLPTTQQCDVCHTTTAWRPTSFSHTGVVAGTCATCHNGTAAAGKPPIHIPTSQSCDACHRTGLAWLPLITPYAHTGIAAGSCATCHTSTYPNMDAKPALHPPTVAACDACHHSFTTWLPTTYNHAGVPTGTCQSCHGGTYPTIRAKPGNHIPTLTPTGMPGNECSLCHTSTTSFANERMNHGTMQTSCVVCHDRSSTYLGSMEKINRSSGDHRDHNAAGKDCSSSNCHKPLGTRGIPYSRWTN